MITRSVIEEWDNLPKSNTLSIINSVRMMQEFAQVRLINTEKNELIYQVRLDDIYNSKMTFEDLIEIREGGWELDRENNFLIKRI